uniref:Uncharacterized protein n=2 Tax=Triticum urartu TaxID=4572 RepID=A0A8R7P7A9_TRIUA
MLDTPHEEEGQCNQADEDKEPVRTDDSSWNLELAGEWPPWFRHELLGVPWYSISAIIIHIVVWPNGITIAICPLGLKEPAVMVKLTGLVVHSALLHQRKTPLHLAPWPMWQRESPCQLIAGVGEDFFPLGVLVKLFAPGADTAATLDGVGEAVDADFEVTLTGEDVLPTAVAHDLAVASLDHADGALGARSTHVGVRALLVHDMGTGDAVEAAGEERAGDVLLVGLGAVLLHGLVVRRHGDVDMVVLEVDAADL